MLFPGRTGSTYLTSHFISHPEIVARYEILGNVRKTWEDQLACLDQLYNKKRFPVIKAVGFKSKLSQIVDRKAFRDYIIERDFRVIHQVRTNHLKYIVSVIRARMLRSKHGVSNLLESDQKPIGAVEIPEPIFARAKKRLNVVGRLDRFVERLPLKKLTLIYEDMLDNEAQELQKAWQFLGVSNTPTEGLTSKNTPDDIRQVVTNLDELIDKHPEMAQFVD
jgi:hypothetical protein